MALIVCPECGKEISDRAPMCPNCGCPIASTQKLSEDNDKKMANLYDRARKSLEVDDLEHAAEYYKEILDANPDDWEAYFYSYLGETTSFTNAQAGGVASKLGKTIPTAYDMAVNSDDSDEIARRVKLISEKTAERLLGIAITGKALLQQYEDGNILTPQGKVNRNLYNNLRPTAQNTVASSVFAFDSLVEKIETIYKDGKISEETRKDALLALLHPRLNIANMTFNPALGLTEKMITDEFIQRYAQQIKDIDPDFQMPNLSSKATANNNGGCYVATAVYGSYDCPQVWTLRRYRDYSLAETWYGRAFIKTYYAISPTLVKWFGHTEWFRKMWRGKLDHMVRKLQLEGYESTPYEDKEW